jgi:hypothetical protein
MKLRQRLEARRREKARRRYEQECERREGQQERDPEELVRDVTRAAAPGLTPHNS